MGEAGASSNPDDRRRPVPVPAQLPAPAARFAHRREELAELESVRRDRGRPPLAVLSGPGGVGKTALALRWLHGVREDYPDGQLYVDLGAFTRGGPLQPDTVLHWFLLALGVPAGDIPAERSQREALYRTMTADKSLAFLLDNAISAAQVRPLLPVTRRGVVVVTSRHRLTGLEIDGAKVIDIGFLNPRESVDVLAELVGAERVRAEPEAADELAAACAGLPIALTLVAGRLRRHQRRRLSREASSLAERGRVLQLTPEDGPSIDAVFAASYDGLSPLAAELFQVCGAHPGITFAPAVIADVSGLDLDRTEDGIDELVDRNLLIDVAGGRVRFHELVQLHARARAEDSMVRAVVQWYLDVLVEADSLVHPHRTMWGPGYAAGPRENPRFADREQALHWLREESEAIRAAFSEADRNGWHELVWQYCEASWGFFLLYRQYDDFVESQRRGIVAARECAEPLVEARLHSQLGFALAQLRRYDESIAENEVALSLATEHGHEPSVATALAQLGRCARGKGELPEALDYYRRAAELQESLGITRGVALCRRRAGDVLAKLGRYDEAEGELRAAAGLMRELGDRNQYARALMVLGAAQRQRGELAESADVLEEALRVVRDLGSPYYLAEVLAELGDLAQAGADPAAARAYLTEAKENYLIAGDPKADAIAARLEALAR
ncbi:tetratricopeptide repeat protein [Amycolatopsis sp. 195334CR]|uniref:tetratricopeptide repeat protein n=1 Tax=Amycolatopsis sp. 195334CR TaxID=2814588 RepID=UPI001A8E4795|nr:tetratricopeptide repeat protein [Amycolatopsis sp. 195334CR]MBN6037830.1 tetratricopeptide repeat protein [Amycolatopsis sp. 195334CR]